MKLKPMLSSEDKSLEDGRVLARERFVGERVALERELELVLALVGWEYVEKGR